VFTRIDNWYEERLSVPQPKQEYVNERNIRPIDNDINCLNSNGLPKPLARLHRAHKWNTGNIIADDNFREMTTINKAEYVNPYSLKVQEKKNEKMINKYNIAELSLVDRPIKGPDAGFGSQLNKHEHTHDRRYFNTTNGDHYGQAVKKSAEETAKELEITGSVKAGGPVGTKEEGIHKISPLTGENFKPDPDIKENTMIQRTWIARPDPGIEVIRRAPNTTNNYN